MRTVVCFDAAGRSYCISVGSIRSVRLATGIVALPAPRADVAGILPGDPPITVVCPLGSTGSQVLVLEVGLKTFGLLVDSVIGLRQVTDAVGQPPDGQDRDLVRETVVADGRLLLVADPAILAGQL